MRPSWPCPAHEHWLLCPFSLQVERRRRVICLATVTKVGRPVKIHFPSPFTTWQEPAQTASNVESNIPPVWRLSILTLMRPHGGSSVLRLVCANTIAVQVSWRWIRFAMEMEKSQGNRISCLTTRWDCFTFRAESPYFKPWLHTSMEWTSVDKSQKKSKVSHAFFFLFFLGARRMSVIITSGLWTYFCLKESHFLFITWLSGSVSLHSSLLSAFHSGTAH